MAVGPTQSNNAVPILLTALEGSTPTSVAVGLLDSKIGMKLKFLLILLVFSLFVGCNRSANSEPSAATTPADPASQSVAAESPIAVTPTVATAATATPGLSAEARLPG